MSKKYCAIATSDGRAWVVHGGALGDVVCYDEASAQTIVNALNDQAGARASTVLRRAEAARDAIDRLVRAIENNQ